MTKYTDFMVDLETLGNTSNAAVVQAETALRCFKRINEAALALKNQIVVDNGNS